MVSDQLEQQVGSKTSAIMKRIMIRYSRQTRPTTNTRMNGVSAHSNLERLATDNIGFSVPKMALI